MADSRQLFVVERRERGHGTVDAGTVPYDVGEQSGIEQYAVKRFADALTHAPRQLAENSGVKGRQFVAAAAAAHEGGQAAAACDIDSDKPALVDAVKEQVGIIITFLSSA